MANVRKNQSRFIFSKGFPPSEDEKSGNFLHCWDDWIGLLVGLLGWIAGWIAWLVFSF